MKYYLGKPTNLITGFQNGEEESFNKLFRELYPRLCFFAYEFIKDKSLAEDVVQDAFVKVWEQRERMKSIAFLKSYMYTMIRNACIDHKQKVKKINDGKYTVESITVSKEEPIDYKIIRAEVIGELHAAIETLPKQCRIIFKKIFFEGKSYEQIASEMGIAVSTVRTQKARGIMLIKRMNKWGLVLLIGYSCLN